MLGVVLEQDLVLPKIFLHALGYEGLQIIVKVAEVQTTQRTADDEPVEATQHPCNLVAIFLDKLLHGVLLVSMDWDFNDTIVQRRTPVLLRTYLRRSRAVLQD
jgi:hypothetical protein